MSREEIDKKLSDIRELKDNWNENGAKPFSKEHIAKTAYFLNVVPPPDFIAPTARGSIQIEYEGIDGTYIEYEIFEDRIEEFDLINGREYEETILTAWDLIYSLTSLKYHVT